MPFFDSTDKIRVFLISLYLSLWSNAWIPSLQALSFMSAKSSLRWLWNATHTFSQQRIPQGLGRDWIPCGTTSNFSSWILSIILRASRQEALSWWNKTYFFARSLNFLFQLAQKVNRWSTNKCRNDHDLSCKWDAFHVFQCWFFLNCPLYWMLFCLRRIVANSGFPHRNKPPQKLCRDGLVESQTLFR